MATLILQRDSELLLFVKDGILIHDISNNQQRFTKICEPPPVVKNSENRRTASARFSKDLQLLAVILSNKQLVVYDKEFKKELCNIMTNRTCNSIRFTNENDVLVADKTGDVYLYKMNNFQQPVLLLGHLSMLLDVEISNCGKFIITCDRDEKIRVSCFPNCYNIKSYCLGHTEFVTNVEVQGNVLISCSGDGSIRVWDFLTGRQLVIIDTNKNIEDKSIIKRFCEEMDNEKVDVQTLPIIDMKIHSKDNVIILGVRLLDYNGIQIYHIDVSELKVKCTQNINVKSKVIAFSLTSELIILTCNTLSIYSLQNNCYTEVTCLDLAQIYNNYKLDVKFECTDDISALYKRKFDNVQEYLEKKKLRLATST